MVIFHGYISYVGLPEGTWFRHKGRNNHSEFTCIDLAHDTVDDGKNPNPQFIRFGKLT